MKHRDPQQEGQKAERRLGFLEKTRSYKRDYSLTEYRLSLAQELKCQVCVLTQNHILEQKGVLSHSATEKGCCEN